MTPLRPSAAALVGVIHLPPLPGSPRAARGAMGAALERAAADARALADAGFDAAIVENFGDVPFFAERVPAETIAAMTACALEARRAAPALLLGVNVLRNDALAAVAVAHAAGAAFVRVNVHAHARLTDQGVVQGRAAETLRLRAALGADVEIWADVDVKHSSPLAPLALEDEARDLAARALADALIVTGRGTGEPVDREALRRVRAAPFARVYVGSGATVEALPGLRAEAAGVIVGSALRANGRAGGPVDAARAAAFARAFRGG